MFQQIHSIIVQGLLLDYVDYVVQLLRSIFVNDEVHLNIIVIIYTINYSTAIHELYTQLK